MGGWAQRPGLTMNFVPHYFHYISIIIRVMVNQATRPDPDTSGEGTGGAEPDLQLKYQIPTVRGAGTHVSGFSLCHTHQQSDESDTTRAPLRMTNQTTLGQKSSC